MKYQFTRPPRPHQVPALKFLLKNRGGGLQVPMRWGKTKIAVDFANCLHLMEGIKRVLVITPISGIGVWEDEIHLNTPPGIDLEWRIVNFESTYDRQPYRHQRGWFPVDSHDLLSLKAELVIVDESHHIGNPNAISSKAVYTLGRQARFRLFMTGTMFHRKPFYTFGQLKFYDPSIFGTSFSAFKNRIAIWGGVGGHQVLRYINLEWMMDRIKPHVFIEEYVPPLNEPVVNKITFKLTGRGLKAYTDMEKDSVLQVGDETVVSPIILSRHLRCQQIAGGWVKTDNKYRRVGDDLLRVVKDRFSEYATQGIEKVVVGCRFIPEIRDAREAAVAAGFKPILFHGGVPRDERKERIRDFQRSKVPTMFISQLQTGKEAIDLSAADVMAFIGLSESYVVHDQFSRRIEKYNEERTLMYDYFIPRGTRTEVTFEALQTKQDVARLMAVDPGRVEEITSMLKETL